MKIWDQPLINTNGHEKGVLLNRRQKSGTRSQSSTLQRIEIGARELLHFAEVAGVKTESRAEHLFFQIQMKMGRQTREHPKAGVVVKFANNPLAVIQNRIGQG